MHVGIFHLEHVKVLGHSVHFSKKWVVPQECLIVDRNEQKFGSRGGGGGRGYVACMLVFFTLNISRSFRVIPSTFFKFGL